MKDKKRILVTGSNGLLGQKLTDLLQYDENYLLLATATGPNRYPDKEIAYQTLDITNAEEIEKIVLAFMPHIIINTAAMTNVDACETEKEKCDILNISALKYLANAANICGAKLIHISTDFIFDGKNGPYLETDVANPLSYYGLSKLKGEQIVMQDAKNWAIIRTVLVYGTVNDLSRSNIVLWAIASLKENKQLNIVDDQFRTPTFAEDLAMGCKLIADSNAKGVYNISGKDFMSIFELVNRVAVFFNYNSNNVLKSDSKNLNQAAKRPPVTGFILDKAIKELDYRPHSFEEALAIINKQLN